jgi:hypothetical protein
VNSNELFNLAPQPGLPPGIEWLAPGVPVITIDNFYLSPKEVRDYALTLDYEVPPYPYPGRLAKIPGLNTSLENVKSVVLSLVNNVFRPQVPIAMKGRSIDRYSNLHTDFGIVDLTPTQLSPQQRIPHTDPVPVFGLVYLNEEDRGGTIFFKQVAAVTPASLEPGYPSGASNAFREIARIKPAFNRLVIYPGFVPHSGEIVGDWIQGPERLSNPRLTQRFAFFP